MMTLAMQLLIQSSEQRIHNKEQNAVGEKVMALESNACVCVCIPYRLAVISYLDLCYLSSQCTALGLLEPSAHSSNHVPL